MIAATPGTKSARTELIMMMIMMKHFVRRLWPTLFTLVVMTGPALAHNLILEAYPFGETIAGEAFFSDGVMVGESVVEIIGPDGERIGEVLTDPHGSFSYTPTESLDLTFRLDAGAGHVAEATVAAKTLDVQHPPTSGRSVVAPVRLSAGVEAEIAAVIREQLRPMRQDLARYSAHSSYPVVLGGIGYIVGLAGLGFVVMARRRKLNA
ncbi:MAG TPA: cobalt ABC transporter permease [Pelagibacterium sp.]|nr:cobalt ABC transporter permease [Pelagibacterium sp.]HCO55090.1 cobalt ABC transporter permease [Pelagibacterium sp.]|tara:strand:+ start:3271 stop:3894 length:624 start_codon:yes stop_codon:yes gene_type:complete